MDPDNKLYIDGPKDIFLDGIRGYEYWVYKYTEFFKDKRTLNEKLSGFPFCIFQSIGRNPRDSPIVYIFQDFGEGYKSNEFLIRFITEMGLNVYLFDYAFTGRREIASLIDKKTSEPLNFIDIFGNLDQGLSFDVSFIDKYMNRFYQDIYYMRFIGGQYHSLRSHFIIFIGFGVAGTLASIMYDQCAMASCFLGINSHPNLSLLIQSITSVIIPEIERVPLDNLITWCKKHHSEWTDSAVSLICMLKSLADESSEMSCYISTFSLINNETEVQHKIRFLNGRNVTYLKWEEVHSCLGKYDNAEDYLVENLVTYGGDIPIESINHIKFYVGSQLPDYHLDINAYYREFDDPCEEEIKLLTAPIHILSKQEREIMSLFHDDNLLYNLNKLPIKNELNNLVDRDYEDDFQFPSDEFSISSGGFQALPPNREQYSYNSSRDLTPKGDDHKTVDTTQIPKAYMVCPGCGDFIFCRDCQNETQ